MSGNALHIKLKITFPVILIAVAFLHALLLAFKGLPYLTKLLSEAEKSAPRTLKIRDIRTVGSRESRIKDSTYLSKNESTVKSIAPQKVSKTLQSSNNSVSVPQKRPLSFSDLSFNKNTTSTGAPQKLQRPGTRPEVTENKKSISAISLKGKEIKEFMRQSSSASIASNAADLSGDPRTRSLNNSDILVNLEVPEGVNPDELNKYELMFYGFQRRTAINYVNAFYKNLDKFQRENPHLNFPMTDTKQVMTGRLTYDEKGNVKQIKMIRWTNVDRLQNFFEDVLKDMDTLHNPPKPLWSQTGEFSIFFSLVING